MRIHFRFADLHGLWRGQESFFPSRESLRCSQSNKDAASRTIQQNLALGRVIEAPGQFSTEQRDQAENNERGELKEHAQGHDLQGHVSQGRNCGLGQQGQKE